MATDDSTSDDSTADHRTTDDSTTDDADPGSAYDEKTLSSDDANEATVDARHQIQLAVVEVFRSSAGASVREVRTALEEALVRHGLPEQPERWTEVTAEEIAAGRRVVVEAIAQLPEGETGHDDVVTRPGHDASDPDHAAR